MNDDDDISITSTAPSEQESEYEVETILAELEFDDGIKYLVKWANYPIERCTWEPPESFCNEQTLIDWNKKKKAIAEGKRPAFDLVRFENHLAALERAKHDRKQRRAAKRRRLGLDGAQQSHPAAESPPSNIVPDPRIPDDIGFNDIEVDRSKASSGQTRTNGSTGSAQLQTQQLPKRPPPPILFGTAPAPTRPKRMNSSETPKLFNLSTRWKYEKAKAYEPPPDMNKLQLIRPSDWPARTGLAASKTGLHSVGSPSAKNDASTARLGSHNVISPTQDDSSSAKLGPHDVSSPKLGDLGSVKIGSHDVSSSKQFNASLVKLGSYNVSSPKSVTSGRLGMHNVSVSNGINDSALDPRSQDVGSPINLDSDNETQGQIGQTRENWALSSPERAQDGSYKPNDSVPDTYRPACGADTWRPDRPLPDSWSASQPSGDSVRPNTSPPIHRHELEDYPIPKLPTREPKPGAYVVKNRQHHFWNQGELLVYLYYGHEKKEIGSARLCGLSPESRSRLMSTKRGSRINVWFQHTCDLEEYNVLCESTKNNKKYSDAWIEGFDDTEPSIYRIGEELRRNELVAISYPAPGSRMSNVLLAYSPKSSDFAFLNADSAHFRIPEDVFLNVAVRSQLRGFDTITARRERKRLHAGSHKPIPLALINAADAPSRAPTTGAMATRPRSVGVPGVSAPEAARPVNDMSNLRIRIPRDSRVLPPKAFEASDVTKPSDAANDSNSTNTTSVTPKLSTQHSGADNLQVAPQNTPRDLELVNVAVRDPAQETGALLSTWQLPLPKHRTPQPATETSPMSSEARTAPEAGPEFPRLKHDASMSQSVAVDVNSPSQPSKNSLDLDAVFKEQFGVTYALLATVNDAEKPTKAQVFYLMFPAGSEVVQEDCADSMKAHESFMNYHALPFIRDLIHRSVSFWSLSLRKPLQYADHPTYFQRVFPHGGVILITEDFMLRDPDATLIILAWLKDWIKQKFPGSWKIMFRPNILDWLLKQSESKDPFRQGIFLSMYALILQLNSRVAGSERTSGNILSGASGEHNEDPVISLDAIPLYGSRTEDDDANIHKGLTHEQRNTDHLGEFFAGWAIVNNHRFRRFVMLTAVKPLPRWEAWQHIEIRYGAKDFMKTFKVEYKTYWDKVKPRLGKPGLSSEAKSRSHNPAYTPRTPGANGPSADGLDVSRVDELSHGPSRLKYPQPYQ
ncbi:putative Chromo domain protein Chp1p [Aspergillus fischeri NRRL 181]|uniref:Chromo domain protein n=1 Tax=Neosartorya fischeri (strain ATCC 1020 / DSM 3700 / CBS 544.65 / FGSC A1164 / JCM 1740 / NRRL 181 / WB 181) TaxID=331117 RepID=A1D543_NEOFI|nr:chromo domain protein [Aspergillus fischeri NRRL 181]EAW23536.1 chromo domain protein [Aspergillus fischeri NRRL 181]